MTTITQKIPNLLGGISQQPDVKKFPGEVRKCINAFPEYALGLMKRPGSKVEALLRGAALPGASAATPSGQSAVTRHYGATEKWFDINVDGVPYVGQINDYSYTENGSKDQLSLKLWFKDSGIPRAVNLDNYMEANYISSGSWSNYQTQINAEAGAIVAKIGGLSTFQTEQKTYYTNYQNTIDNLDNIFRVDTTYNKGEVYQFIFNGVLQDENDNISFIKDGDVMTGSMPTTQATGDVILKSSTLTNLSLTAPGSGYQFTPTLDISGSGTSASGTLTLKEKGSFAGIEITNSGEGYSHEPVVNLTGDLAAICHPKCTMTGPWDDTFATADNPTKVVDIQLNPGKEIKFDKVLAYNEGTDSGYELEESHTSQANAAVQYNKTQFLASDCELVTSYSSNACDLVVCPRSGVGHSRNSSYYLHTGDNVRSPEPFLTNGSTGNSSQKFEDIYIKPQDLTNVHTIRFYGISGIF